MWPLHLLDEIGLYTHGKKNSFFIPFISSGWIQVSAGQADGSRVHLFQKFATRRMICDAMLHMYGAVNANKYRCISLGLRFIELWHYGLKKPSQDLTWFRRFKSMAEPPLPMSTERQQIASLSILLQISMLGLAFVLGHILRRHKFYYLHEASASLLIGAFFLTNLKLLLFEISRWLLEEIILSINCPHLTGIVHPT